MTIAAIIFSYNRPNFIREALQSAKDNKADQIIVCDDGSDTIEQIREVCKEFDALLLEWPAREPESRIKKVYLGELAAAAIEKCTTDYIAWLCDDDYFAPGWFDHVRGLPERDLYIGDVTFFPTAEPWKGTSWEQLGHDPSYMTTGNFIHKRGLAVAWPTNVIHGQDAFFVYGLLNVLGIRDPRTVLEPITALFYRCHDGQLRYYCYNPIAMIRKYGSKSMEN